MIILIIESFVLVSHRTIVTNATSKTDVVTKILLRLKPAWAMQWVPDLLGLPNEIVFQLPKDIYYKTMSLTFHIVKGALELLFLINLSGNFIRQSQILELNMPCFWFSIDVRTSLSYFLKGKTFQLIVQILFT